MSPADTTRFTGRDEGGTAMRAASFCALIMAGAIWWLAGMPPDARHQSILILVSAIGASVGPFLLINGVRTGLRLRRYRRSVIEIDRPVQGEPLRGLIRTERPVDAVGPYTVRLRCEDSQGRLVATTLFKSVCYVPHSYGDSSDGIPFAIEPTNSQKNEACWDRLSNSKMRWWIDLHAMTEFIGYSATFKITDLLRQSPDSDAVPWWMKTGSAVEG